MLTQFPFVRIFDLAIHSSVRNERKGGVFVGSSVVSRGVDATRLRRFVWDLARFFVNKVSLSVVRSSFALRSFFVRSCVRAYLNQYIVLIGLFFLFLYRETPAIFWAAVNRSHALEYHNALKSLAIILCKIIV